jgi:tetraacyldisaccharide 4'-kinase
VIGGWHEARESAGRRLLLAPLAPLSWAFGGVGAVRRFLYRTGLLPSARAPIPVISVGNLAVGGAGKTPVTLHLAALLVSRGHRPAILSRGYGGSGRGPRIVSRGDGRGPVLSAAEAGDEPVLLARRLPDVAVLAGPSRAELASLAARELGRDVALLDDGFQHLALSRDLDLVVLDGGSPFGNGRLLPRGPLREGPKALARAHLAWITKVDEGDPAVVEAAAARAREATGREPVRSRYRVAGLLAAGLDRIHPAGSLAGCRVGLLAGLARPDSFRRTVLAAGAEVAFAALFPDHHRFTAAEVEAALARLAPEGADLLVLTEKDAVRLPPGVLADGRLAVLRVDTEVVGGAESLLACLASVLPGTAADPRTASAHGGGPR